MPTTNSNPGAAPQLPQQAHGGACRRISTSRASARARCVCRGRLFALLLGLAAFGAPTWVAAALTPASFVSLGDEEAIPDNIVTALAEDASGLLWIGTSDGLVSFDGYRFRRHISNSPYPGAARGSFVRVLLKARDGRLWIGTEADGLSVYDPRNGEFHRFVHEPGRAGTLPPGRIQALAEGPDGAIWVATLGHGVQRLDQHRRRFVGFGARSAAGLGGPETRVEALRFDRRGRLWLGTWNGLYRLEPGAANYQPAWPALAGKVVLSLLPSQDGKLWIGTEDGLLARADPEGAAFQWFKPGASGTPDRRSAIQTLLEVEGQVWVGRSRGIEVRAAADGRLLDTLRRDRGDVTLMRGHDVRALVRDRSGGLWIGGYGTGLIRHMPTSPGVRVHGAQPGWSGVLADADVSSILQRRNGEIWVGGSGKGIAVLNRRLQLIGGFAPRPGEPYGLRGDRIRALTETAAGVVWAGGARLYRYRPAVNGFEEFAAKDGLATRDVRRLLAAPDGVLWIGTADGLFRFANGAKRIEAVTMANDSAATLPVNALARDRDGRLWVGTAHGLYSIPPEGGSLQPVEAVRGRGLAHPTVVGLLIDRGGTLWVDTSGGLHRLLRWDGKRAEFESISKRLGLRRRPFGANLLEDAHGRIWSHQHVYDPARQWVYRLTHTDGVDFGTGWFRAYEKTRDGRLLFAGSQGLLEIDPERFRPWDYAPPLLVTEVRIDGERQPFSTGLRELTLRPGQRGFSLEFAALDYSAPERNRYAYRLENHDDAWTEVDAGHRSLSYAGLAPGEYTLHLRGSNRVGRWSPHQLTLKVRVQPAWWQTLWARALIGLSVAAAIGLIVLRRTRTLRRRELALERKVQERTAELEKASRVKSEFLANMSHEIRTPMNAVLGLARLCLGTPLSPQQRDYLQKIVDAGNVLLVLINDILDVAKVESGKLELECVPFELNQVFEQVRSLMAPRAEEKGLVLHFDAPQERRRLLGDPVRLGQVLLNLVSNAVKFTECGRVEVRAERLADAGADMLYRFAVKDSGIGISETQRQRLFQPFVQADTSTTRRYGGTGLGLVICRNLVECMGGAIDVQSTPGSGSEFVFTARFPRADAESGPVAPSQGQALEPWLTPAARSLRGRCVLLVDDNPINQQVAQEWLSRAGIEVSTADDGRQALARLQHEAFDAVLVDIQMPVMDGYETAAAIRAHPGLRQLPVIAMTANAMAEDRRRCLLAGMDDHIPKPIDPDEMFRVLARHLTRTQASEAGVTGARAEPTGADGTLDWAAIVRRLGGNPEIASVVLRNYSQRHASTAAAIDQALCQGQIEQAQFLLHTLKGTAGTIGLDEVAAAARALEEALHTGDDGALAPRLERLHAACAQANQELAMLPT